MHGNLDHGGAGVTRYAEVMVGDTVPEQKFRVDRADLVRYAGASGDLNPIHWNDRAARDAGLPGVIAHGMLTMGLAVRVVTDWTGDPGCVVRYRTRFRGLVVVADLDGAEVTAGGVVRDKLPGDQVTIALSVHCGPDKVLAAASVVAQLR